VLAEACSARLIQSDHTVVPAEIVVEHD
jgi:hypothetical protein